MSDRFTRLTFFLRLAAGIHLLSYGSMHTRHTQRHTPTRGTNTFSFRVRATGTLLRGSGSRRFSSPGLPLCV